MKNNKYVNSGSMWHKNALNIMQHTRK